VQVVNSALLQRYPCENSAALTVIRNGAGIIGASAGDNQRHSKSAAIEQMAVLAEMLANKAGLK
jgi:hypothetical protein